MSFVVQFATCKNYDDETGNDNRTAAHGNYCHRELTLADF